MKYLLVVLVVVVFVYLLLGRRPRSGAEKVQREAPPPPAEPARMLACAQCGVHLPRDDALFDSRGRGYCCEAHLRAGS
jgi:uncharacterized protein